ncbi:MAG: sulfatase-like hydrolase/transferase [Candidatus Cryptobacteroides sp.]
MNAKLLLTLPSMAAVACGCADKQEINRPNILLIVADDLGLGDISTYGSTTIHTPNIDSLGHNGIRFDNGYATSATSTPSRYAMFTGLYPWTNANAKILPGDAPLLIPTDCPTLPEMLQDIGYNTGAIGKWHLGMGNGNVDWNKEISPSANTVGFDYTCLVAATNDRVPTVYVRDGKVVGLDPDDPIYVDYEHNFDGEPTALTNPEMLKMKWHHGHNNSIVNGIPRIGFMKGGKKARWVDEDMADFFVSEVKEFIDRQTSDVPFFLYYGLHQPHVPRTPNARFVGSTTLGPRGDAIAEADWCVGEVISYLDSKGYLDNTLVIFTSDNGPVVNDGYYDEAEEKLGNHDPRNGTRGGKYSLYDGGTHIPLIVYWKGHVSPMVSGALVSHLDFFASLGRLTGGKVPDGLDSDDYMDVLLGKTEKGRDELVLEAQGRLALRYGHFALIPPYDGPESNITKNELGNLKEWGLFDLSKDRGQTENIAVQDPDRLEEMKARFQDLVGDYYRPDVEEEELK